MNPIEMKNHVDSILQKLIQTSAVETETGAKLSINFYGYDYSVEIDHIASRDKQKVNEAWGLLSSKLFTDFERGVAFTEALEKLEGIYAERESLLQDQKTQ